MQVGIVAQRDNPSAVTLASELIERLQTEDIAVGVDSATASRLGADPAVTERPVEEVAGCDFVVSIGGDGTFLFAAHHAGTTPIMGINLGEVGFLNAVSPAEAVAVVNREIERIRDQGPTATRSMRRLAASGDGWTVPPAINEITVLGPQRGHGQGLDLDVRIDGSPYTSGHADGVLVATPTGSTAYNLSENGPLVHPAVDGFIVTEMAGTEPMPPLVVDENASIEVTVTDAPEAVVISDGRDGEEITPPATVELECADTPVNVAGPPLDFFAGLGKLE